MIGTRLCEQLLQKPHEYEVVGLDWKKNPWSPRVEVLTRLVDLRDKDATIAHVPESFDFVIHLAANARVHDLVNDPSMARDNQETTFNVLELARLRGIKKVIFASSREVYGNTETFFHAEGDANHALCESPYTASKLAGEAWVWAYHRCYGMDMLIFRFSNVYGMYDESDRAIPFFIRKAQKNDPITVFGKEKLLDFTFLDDTVEGIIAGIERFDQAKNRVINLATGHGSTILEVAQMITAGLGSESSIQVLETRTGEVMKYVADITAANILLGYTPKVTIEEGIKRSILWYGQRPSSANL